MIRLMSKKLEVKYRKDTFLCSPFQWSILLPFHWRFVSTMKFHEPLHLYPNRCEPKCSHSHYSPNLALIYPTPNKTQNSQDNPAQCNAINLCPIHNLAHLIIIIKHKVFLCIHSLLSFVVFVFGSAHKTHSTCQPQLYVYICIYGNASMARRNEIPNVSFDMLFLFGSPEIYSSITRKGNSSPHTILCVSSDLRHADRFERRTLWCLEYIYTYSKLFAFCESKRRDEIKITSHPSPYVW